MTEERLDHSQERRLVTVLFADLVRLHVCLRIADPNHPGGTEPLLQLPSREIKRLAGYVDKIVGDEIALSVRRSAGG
jgi:class 3 adenylate cyclase